MPWQHHVSVQLQIHKPKLLACNPIKVSEQVRGFNAVGWFVTLMPEVADGFLTCLGQKID